MNVLLDTSIFLGKFLYYFLESLYYKIIPKKKKDVTGEIVLITGAASGLGRLLAIKFASLGAILVLWDINEEGNMETCRMIKEERDAKVFAYTCDCSNRQDVYRVADQVSWLVFLVLCPRKVLHLICAFAKRRGEILSYTSFPMPLAWVCMSEIWLCGDFPGSPVVRTPLLVQGSWVQSLVGDWSQKKKKKRTWICGLQKRKQENNATVNLMSLLSCCQLLFWWLIATRSL